MRRAERLDTLGRNRNAVEKLVLLKYISDFNKTFEPPADGPAEGVIKIALDDKHDLVEPGADRVINRKVNDKFACAADGVDLLESFIA